MPPDYQENLPVHCKLRVRGTVQGVGFRPFIWRLAGQYKLKGSVANDADGVIIFLSGAPAAIEAIVEEIKCNSPVLARVDTVETWRLDSKADYDDFVILESSGGNPRTGVAADAGSCNDCLREVLDSNNRRYQYPFTNCTNCGPRLSIIKTIPYDRANTSMAAFRLCLACLSEYENPEDRRFHAQPNACFVCGPRLELKSSRRSQSDSLHAGEFAEMSSAELLDRAALLIKEGKIIAVKALGGFQLLCDACNDNAVSTLRLRKGRLAKPLALLARDLRQVSNYALISDSEANLLSDSGKLILLLKKKSVDAAVVEAAPLAESIAPAMDTLGFMLPSTPLYALLLARLDAPLVCSSGNLSEEPQCTDNDDAERRLAEIADYFLLHDRDIVNRVDDSVLKFMSGIPRVLRRGRGMAPDAIALPEGFKVEKQILAMGGELKNTFCLLKQSEAILSPHIGDLKDACSYSDYKKMLALFQNLYQFTADEYAVDQHPAYMSTRLGKELARAESKRLHEVQHHHAHIAACLFENQHPLSSPAVLAVVLDGLGYAPEGLWGGEFILADYRSYERLASLKPVALIGGDKAMKEPWRNLYAQIRACMGWKEFQKSYKELELSEMLARKPLAVIDAMMAANANVPLASSTGRLFDAVAAALGICFESVSFEGQAAMELESIVERSDLEQMKVDSNIYQFRTCPGTDSSPLFLDPAPLWKAIFDGLVRGESKGMLAAGFHVSFAAAIANLVLELSAKEKTGSNSRFSKVVLSGGVFQNKVLLEETESRLIALGFEVLTHKLVPCNDGGLALGQAAVSAARAQAPI